ncbi:unnamed protein product [Strongylus vulgaris]|uniref:Peptidase C1A papain C-terminal domain-containing protein n=1 Tax=Strongylus vulgaris TaxID=40348 RepID=A0A3P7I5L8_STRVU|nr:unnamed protein product [Strongylus vulgaris]
MTDNATINLDMVCQERIMIAIFLTLFTASFVTANKIMSIAEFKARPIPEYAKHLTGQALIDYINNNQPYFTISVVLQANHSSMTYEEFKSRLMDVKYLTKCTNIRKIKESASNEKIPDRFDAREKWRDCESIRTIRDQANCGSCWAVSAASVMSDRLCIRSKGKIQKIVSDADILSCCGSFCGNGYV